MPSTNLNRFRNGEFGDSDDRSASAAAQLATGKELGYYWATGDPDDVLTLDSGRLAAATIPIGTGWLLGACMEARGKQDLWVKQKPEVLAALRNQAMIQSAESSNRIEGVTVLANRLRPLVLGGAKPRDRSEEELAGYRRALDWVFSRKGAVSITPDVIRRLHALAQGGHSGDAGEWKQRGNEIVEILPNGERRIRFVPTTARETPKVIAALCQRYQEEIGRAHV